MLDQAYDAIFAWDLDGTIIFWNHGAELLYGYTPAEAIGRFSSHLLQTGPPEAVAAFRAAMVSDGTWEGELRHACKDGRRLVLESRLTVIEEGDRRIVLEVCRDVTRRREVERNLSILAEAGGVLSSSLDVETTLAAVARLVVPGLADWCSIHVLGQQGAAEQVAVAHVDPAKVAWAHELQKRFPYDPYAPAGVPNVIRTGQPELYPAIPEEMLRASIADPEQLAIAREAGFSAVLIVPLLARGTALGAIPLVAAESGRHFTEDDLALATELAHRAGLAVDNARLFRASQAAEARYRALFEGIADSVVVSDLHGRYLEVNQALCHLLGYTREELLAAKVGDLSTRRDRAERLYTDMMASGAMRGEAELRHRDGSPVPVEVWATQVDLPTGTVNIGVMRDISERKRQERIHQAHLDSIAHDLKNPIGALTVQAQLLTRRAARLQEPEAESVRQGLRRIEAIARRLTSQVEELQDIARLRSGQPLDLHREPTDLVALARDLADEYQQTTDRHTLRVESAVPELAGSWDARRLSRAIANLLTNAIKYSDDGEILLRLEERTEDGQRLACVAVSDQGIGVPATDLETIFEPFRRGSNAGSAIGGVFGLAGFRHSVRQNGGTITGASHEGHGTTFTVCLPMTE
jgi:PAS domain S-box-containing protein